MQYRKHGAGQSLALNRRSWGRKTQKGAAYPLAVVASSSLPAAVGTTAVPQHRAVNTHQALTAATQESMALSCVTHTTLTKLPPFLMYSKHHDPLGSPVIANLLHARNNNTPQTQVEQGP